MPRTRVRFGRVGWLAVGVLLVGNLVGQAAGREAPAPAAPRPPAVHLVRPGDTLWGIARAMVGPEGDPRPAVAELRELNGLGPEPLPAGVSLVLPAG